MRWPSAIAASVALGVAVWVGASFWGFSYDDAFITYRYADNLARHGALEFNLGERVLGTSAPGYAALLAALHRLTGVSIPGLGTALGVASILGVAAALGASAGAGVASVFALLALPFRWNVEMLGSEFLPMVALCVAAAALLVGDGGGWRHGVAGALAGLAAVMRLDAVLFVLVASAFLIWRRRTLPLHFLAAAAATAGAGLLATFAYFGRLVPNTLAAKRAERSIAGLASYSAAEWGWLERCLGIGAVLCLLALAAAGAVLIWRRRQTLHRPWLELVGLLGLWVLGHEAAYRWLGVPFAPWYALPTVTVVLALAAAGFWAAVRWAPGRLRLATLAAALALSTPVAGASAEFTVATAGQAPDPRYAGYREVADHVRAASGGRPATLALTEIGIAGFYSDAPILDLMGLVDPAVLAARRRGALPELVAARRPCYLLDVSLFESEHLAAILAHPDVAARYRPKRKFIDGRHPSIRITLLADASATANC